MHYSRIRTDGYLESVGRDLNVGCGKVDDDVDEDEYKINAVKADDSEVKAGHLGG